MEVVQCPRCQITMREREKGDVIIDICPQCRGVWLDAGELEKLSVRESRYYDNDDDDDDWDDRRRESRGRVPAYRGRDDDDDDDDDRRRGSFDRDDDFRRDGRSTDAYGRPRKKKGFLQSMMESFGGEGGDD